MYFEDYFLVLSFSSALSRIDGSFFFFFFSKLTVTRTNSQVCTIYDICGINSTGGKLGLRIRKFDGVYTFTEVFFSRVGIIEKLIVYVTESDEICGKLLLDMIHELY